MKIKSKAELEAVVNEFNQYLKKDFRISMGNLYGRYLDECKYEPISQYKAVMSDAFAKMNAESGNKFKLIKTTGKPFGFVFAYLDYEAEFKLTYKLKNDYITSTIGGKAL